MQKLKLQSFQEIYTPMREEEEEEEREEEEEEADEEEEGRKDESETDSENEGMEESGNVAKDLILPSQVGIEERNWHVLELGRILRSSEIKLPKKDEERRLKELNDGQLEVHSHVVSITPSHNQIGAILDLNMKTSTGEYQNTLQSILSPRTPFF